VVDIKEVAENIYMIDDQLYSIPEWGSVYLINEEKKALIDTGPTTSSSVVLDGIKRAGVKSEDIDYIIVTHIHLDHAGGAGVIIRDMPHAQVLVHHRGAKYLVNPAKLIGSAIEAQGEETMVKHGEVVPIEAERVKPVYEGDVLKLSEKQDLRFIDAPGHAQHELCIYESRNGGLFTGDAVGMSVAENEILLLDTPPPNFDAELCIDTLERLIKLKATMIYFAHFGVSDKVQENLRSAIGRLQVWDDIITEAAKEDGFEAAAERIMAQVCADLEPVRKIEPLYKYITEVTTPLSIAGYLKYYQKKHRVG
jgi:glyoxylase-like metal-dependent hydrolase (beta-lactamase superfamily II)